MEKNATRSTCPCGWPAGRTVPAAAPEDAAHIDSHLRRHSYRQRGLYSRQLRNLYRCFDPERVLILRAEDLRQRHDAVLRGSSPSWGSRRMSGSRPRSSTRATGGTRHRASPGCCDSPTWASVSGSGRRTAHVELPFTLSTPIAATETAQGADHGRDGVRISTSLLTEREPGHLPSREHRRRGPLSGRDARHWIRWEPCWTMHVSSNRTPPARSK